MGERLRGLQEMATTSTAVTVTPQVTEHCSHYRDNVAAKMVLARKLSLCIRNKEIKLLTKHLSTNARGLLHGINVLDMSRIIAGPYCAMTMGDLGANVMKVESLDGDEARKWGPPFIPGSTDSFYFLSVNRNKKSICVNMKAEQGKQIIHDIARKCDVVIENFLPGKLDELGVGYEQLSKVNPQIVYCAITGFGPTGPYANKPGYDVIAAAMGGLLHCTGSPGGRAVKPAVAITDITTGLHAFGAIMAALHHRQQTGRGQKIDCNLLSTQVASMINLATAHLNCGTETRRWGTAHASIVPYQGFEAQDGEIIIGTGSEPQFQSLCRYLNKEELIHDERFKSNTDRVQNRDALIDIIQNIIKTKTKKEWIEIFKNAPFPNGPLNNLKEVFDDEHIKSIGLVKELKHPDAGVVKLVGPPTVYSTGAYTELTAPPTLGQHTVEITRDFLGYDEAKIKELLDKKPQEPVAVITLRPTKEQSRKKVVWTEDTVDNEYMNKKKSKCCCIYEKPRKFGESDSEDSEDECDHCYGHVERRRATRQHTAEPTHTDTTADVQDGGASTSEPTTTITLQPSDKQTAPPDKPSELPQES